MGRKRQLVEAAVSAAVEAVCKSGGGHPACPVVSGLLDLYLASEFEERSTPRSGIGSGDRARVVRPEAKRDAVTKLVEEKLTRPEEKRDAVTQLVAEKLGGSRFYTDISNFLREQGVPGAEVLLPVIASKFILRGLKAHAGRGIPVGAGGRMVESVASRVSSGGRRRRLNGSKATYYAPPGEAGF